MSSTRRKYTREFKIKAAKLSYNSDKAVYNYPQKLDHELRWNKV